MRAASTAIVEALYARRDAEHYWDPPAWNPDRHGQASQAGGYTPLVVLALLHAGESYQDPRLRDAVEHLRRVELTGTYAVAVRAHVWALLPRRFGEALARDAQWLRAAFHEKAGGWSYDRRPRRRWFDNSLAQYGALGLWEAAKRGHAVDPRCWRRLEQRFLDEQRPGGGWNYRGDAPVSGSMTAAGLTALFITQDFLHARDALEIDPDRAAPADEAIARGLAWLDANFTAARNPGRDTHFFYYLYGVERVGLASGYRTFGGRDWFREGAAAAINRLCTRDASTGAVRVRPDRRLEQLAFGLLFLSRGRVPVAINKLAVPGLAWNNRPRDAANLTAWMGRRTEAELNWQIVGLGDGPRRWLDAPLLYLASHEPLPWAAGGPELESLRTYLDRGGLLFAAAEGRGRRFARSIERAGSLLYPGYAWRRLPDDHWAYTLLWPVKGRRPPLRALSNGVRELIICAPARDLPAALQVRDDDGRRNAASWTTAAHVYLYASEMNRPRPRLDSRAAPAAAPRGGPARATVCRASYAGNWNPEPAALPAFARAMAAGGLEVRLVEQPLSAIGDLAPPPDLVVVSGVAAYEFSPAERAAVRAWVGAGGVILFETAGGAGDFCRSAEAAIGPLLGGPPRPLLDARLVTGAGLAGGASLARVDYRPYAHEAFGMRETVPRLRGIVAGGAPRALFSREDLSNALLDEPCWGVAGYTADSARMLLRNILLHAVDPAEQ